MTSKLSRSSTPDDFVVTGSPPVSATASRRPRAEALQRAWLSWLSIQRRRRKKAEVARRVVKVVRDAKP